jgi:methyltransferase (TIGR00027 family)
MTKIKRVSDTAFWVASYRAKESAREDALFRDPLASRLTGDHGEAVSRSMESVERYAYWSVVLRTCVIDEFISRYTREGCGAVLNLGAGLDTRPYRLSLPAGTRWIEVDLPEVVALKDEKLGDQVAHCELERIGLDLSSRRERRQLFESLGRSKTPTLILTEGVTPYLEESEVAGLAEDLREQSSFRWWVTEYYSPKAYPRYQSPSFQRRLGDSPFRFFPDDWSAFFEASGWTRRETKFLYDEGKERNRPFPLPWWVSLLTKVFSCGRAPREVRELLAYVVLERKP